MRLIGIAKEKGGIIMKHYVLVAAVLSSACIAPQEIASRINHANKSREITICTTEDINEVEMQRLNYFKDSWHIVSPCEVGLNRVSTAMTVFYYMWEEEFGDPDKKVLNSLNRLTIKWGEDDKVMPTIYSISGVRKKNAKVRGLAITKSDIWVKRSKYSLIYNTAFIHELVHISLWATVDTPDADHESTVYKGENYWTTRHTAFIIEVNRMLWALNI